jgi:hypothetical protein
VLAARLVDRLGKPLARSILGEELLTTVAGERQRVSMAGIVVPAALLE